MTVIQLDDSDLISLEADNVYTLHTTDQKMLEWLADHEADLGDEFTKVFDEASIGVEDGEWNPAFIVIKISKGKAPDA